LQRPLHASSQKASILGDRTALVRWQADVGASLQFLIFCWEQAPWQKLQLFCVECQASVKIFILFLFDQTIARAKMAKGFSRSK
jgi:hypothetical protein